MKINLAKQIAKLSVGQSFLTIISDSFISINIEHAKLLLKNNNIIAQEVFETLIMAQEYDLAAYFLNPIDDEFKINVFNEAIDKVNDDICSPLSLMFENYISGNKIEAYNFIIAAFINNPTPRYNPSKTLVSRYLELIPEVVHIACKTNHLEIMLPLLLKFIDFSASIYKNKYNRCFGMLLNSIMHSSEAHKNALAISLKSISTYQIMINIPSEKYFWPFKRKELVDILVKHKFDFRKLSINGYNVLCWAIETGYDVKTLLDNNADLNLAAVFFNHTVLWHACFINSNIKYDDYKYVSVGKELRSKPVSIAEIEFLIKAGGGLRPEQYLDLIKTLFIAGRYDCGYYFFMKKSDVILDEDKLSLVEKLIHRRLQDIERRTNIAIKITNSIKDINIVTYTSLMHIACDTVATSRNETYFDYVMKLGADINLSSATLLSLICSVLHSFSTTKKIVDHKLFVKEDFKRKSEQSILKIFQLGDGELLNLSEEFESILYLIKNDLFNINSQDKLGNTILHYACIYMEPTVIAKLLRYFPAILVNNFNHTPLQILSSMIIHCLKHHLFNSESMIIREQFICSELIINYVSKLSRSEVIDLKNVIHKSLSIRKIIHPNFISLCLKRSIIGVNDEYKPGSFLIHGVIKAGCMKSLEILLKHNCDINVLNREGMAPIHVAINESEELMVQRLLAEKSLNLNLKCIQTGDTAIHLAINTNQKKIVALLLKNNIALVENNNKVSPLQLILENPNFTHNGLHTSINYRFLENMIKINPFLSMADVSCLTSSARLFPRIQKLIPLRELLMKERTKAAIYSLLLCFNKMIGEKNIFMPREMIVLILQIVHQVNGVEPEGRNNPLLSVTI